MEAPANEYKDAHDFVTQERNFSLLFNQITLFIFLIKNEKKKNNLFFWSHCMACGILIPWPGI